MGVLIGLLGGYGALESRNAAFREMSFLKGHLQKFGVRRGLIRKMSVLMGVTGK